MTTIPAPLTSQPTYTLAAEFAAVSSEMTALFLRADIVRLRKDLALALRAAAKHGLSEGVCNHFSVAIPGDDEKFLLNPRGLLWEEVQADDIVLVDKDGSKLVGRHPVEPTAMFIHAAMHRVAKKQVVLHCHSPYATTLTLTPQGMLSTTLSQNAMRFHGRTAQDPYYNGLALDHAEGERLAQATLGADVVFLANHGVVVCGERLDYAYEDLYFLERACQIEVQALSMGVGLRAVDPAIAQKTAEQLQGERLQSELFFQALERTLP